MVKKDRNSLMSQFTIYFVFTRKTLPGLKLILKYIGVGAVKPKAFKMVTR